MKLSTGLKWYEEQKTTQDKRQCLNTLRTIRNYIKRLGDPTIKSLTIQMVVRDRAERIKSAKPSTSNAEVSHLREMISNLFLAGLIASNPIKDIKLLACDNIREVHLTITDAIRLASFAPKWLADLIIFAAYMPMRKSEISGLLWKEIDFNLGDNGVLRLSPDRTKNKKGRSIPLHPKVRKLLLAIPSGLRFQGGRVFPDETLIRKSFNYEFNKVRVKAGLPDTRYHDIRHLAITEMFRVGIPQATIMRLAGHNSESLFHRYVYLKEEELFNLSWG